MGSAAEPIPEVDVLLVGAGFGSFSTLRKLRDGQGLKCMILEKGPSSGGIWYWNTYPGARVDSDSPIYQLFDKELWEDFTFTERYPGGDELLRYFDHVEKKWDLKKDIVYNKNVEYAKFDEKRQQWLVETSCGNQYYCRWFIPAIGFAAKRYVPAIKNLSDFQGDVYHTAVWPQWGVNFRGKNVAIIGTGASGIQTIQEVGQIAKHTTVYQRTPNFCLPMNQRPLNMEEEKKKKASGEYERIMNSLVHTFAGFAYDFADKNTFDDSPEEREKFFHKLLVEDGGFKFWLSTYKDMLFDEKANDEAYKFWRKTVLKRVKDPKKQKMLAPEKKPHPWGTKRPSLEQNFYEVVDRPNVDLIDLHSTPIETITKDGIQTKEGLVKVDAIILATGFDAVTGSLAQLRITGTDNKTIKEHWADGLRTAMGVSLNKFPNMFFLYGPQAPTAFSNGPTCVQVQSAWIDKTIREVRKRGITRFEAKAEMEEEWKNKLNEKWDNSLFPKAKSWYQGANIPGRRVEPLNWAGGMPAYIKALDDSNENDFQGWITTKA